VRFTLRAYLEAGLSPRNAMQTAGAVLEHQLGSYFATAVAATYDPRERVLVYACAGHPPPVVLGPRPIVPTTACSAPPIGVGMRTGTRQTVVSVPGRSQICFYTDGVIEAKLDSELFGVERLTDTLAELGPKATASAVLDRVAEQANRRPDDMAAVLLGVDGGRRAPAIQVEELELDQREAGSARAEQFLLACGVDPYMIAKVRRPAAEAAKGGATASLELRYGTGGPEVSVRHENVAFLQTAALEVAGASAT